jgi:hypothetical protein
MSNHIRAALAQLMSLILQTQLENEESVQKTVKMLRSSMVPSLSESDSHELQSRIEDHISYAPYNLILDVYLILCRELESIRETTAKWTKAKKNLTRRLLDARRVAKELESVTEKITQANQRFLVRGIHQRDDTAMLTWSVD